MSIIKLKIFISRFVLIVQIFVSNLPQPNKDSTGKSYFFFWKRNNNNFTQTQAKGTENVTDEPF